MLIAFLKFISRVPMRWYHRVGVTVGWCAYWCSRREAKRLRDSLQGSGICSSEIEYRALLKESIGQAGKSVIEWFKGWYAPQAEFDRLCAAVPWFGSRGESASARQRYHFSLASSRFISHCRALYRTTCAPHAFVSPAAGAMAPSYHVVGRSKRANFNGRH